MEQEWKGDDFRTATICPRKRYWQRTRAVICRLLNYRDELCKSRRRCYEISRRAVVVEGMRSEKAKAAASVEVNAFAEMPTFDPELFDPEEIRKARGSILHGRLNYCGELCRSRRYEILRGAKGEGTKKKENRLPSNNLMSANHMSVIFTCKGKSN